MNLFRFFPGSFLSIKSTLDFTTKKFNLIFFIHFAIFFLLIDKKYKKMNIEWREKSNNKQERENCSKKSNL